MPEIRKKVVFYEKFKGSLVIWNIDLLNWKMKFWLEVLSFLYMCVLSKYTHTHVKHKEFS